MNVINKQVKTVHDMSLCASAVIFRCLPPEAGFLWWIRFVSHCLAPFEISVLVDRRTALSLRQSLLKRPASYTPLKDNRSPLVLGAFCRLAPFEIGYGPWFRASREDRET